MRNLEINSNGTIFKRIRRYLAYADNVIFRRSIREIESLIGNAQATGLALKSR